MSSQNENRRLTLKECINAYHDGLTTRHELITYLQTLTRGQEPPRMMPTTISAHPCLELGYTEKGIRALITRVNAARELGERIISPNWTVSTDGRRLNGHAILNEDETKSDPGDYRWIMPSIQFELPSGTTVGNTVAERHRHLVVRDGVLQINPLAANQ